MPIHKLLAALLVIALILSFSACSQPADNSQELNQLREENAQLRDEIARLQQEIAVLEAGAIADWTLTGTPLLQGSGAEVTLTVVPTQYQEGQMVSFRVALEGQTIASLYCDWDGTAYSCSVELDAADGYSYSLLLTEPNGTQDYRELNSPANPVDSTLVYMYSSLSAACFLSIEDWQVSENSLSITGGSAEIQLPLMTANGEAISCSGINLVLQLDGEELERKSIMVPQTTQSALQIPLSPTEFAIPELEEGNQLDLWLEVTLSDGQTLHHSGSSWFCYEGELMQAVG